MLLEKYPPPHTEGRGIFFLPTGHFAFNIPSIFRELERHIANLPTEVSTTEKQRRISCDIADGSLTGLPL